MRVTSTVNLSEYDIRQILADRFNTAIENVRMRSVDYDGYGAHIEAVVENVVMDEKVEDK